MKRFVLFDFDGVIADSYATTLRVCKYRCPNFIEEDFIRGFEGNINDWATEFHKNTHSPECRHDIAWPDDYVPEFEKHVQPFVGINEVLKALASEYRLIIISSTITSPIESFLTKFEMGDLFAQVMGNDVHKSKVEKMRMVFEKYGVLANDCVFVTDTLGDMREAKEHEMGAIGVSWGFHPHATLEKGVPFRIVDKPVELLDAVSDFFGK